MPERVSVSAARYAFSPPKRTTDAKGRTRAEVEHRFGAIRLALRVSARKHVEPFRKEKGLRFVISEILKS